MAAAGQMTEKEVAVGVSPSPPASPVAAHTKADDRDLDLAFKYIQDAKQNGGDEAAADNVDLKALRRKIDWHILPVMFLCYTMQFFDKVNINVSIPKINKLRIREDLTKYSTLL
jgi:hypothetical protein